MSIKNKSNHKLPVTVAMVIYNEELLLRRALESCADLVDEIVIVHDGPCQDKSLKIARQFTDKVFIEKKIGSAEPHRPFSFAQAKNEWILQLDADEYLAEDFKKALPELIKKNVVGYKVKWLEEYKGRYLFNMVKEVLFKKSHVYFLGAPMEYIKPVNAKQQLSFAPVSLMNNPLTSKSNYHSWSGYRTKYSSFAKIQAKLCNTPFNEISKWNYSKLDWEPRTRLKIDHPLLLGIGGMNIKYVLELIKKILGLSSDTSFHAIWHLMWYNTFLYWQVFKLNHRI